MQYEKMLTHCRNDVFQMYSRYFEPSLHIATRGDMATSTGSDLCVMKHVKEVFSHGACVTVHGERFFNGMQVSTTEDWHVGASPESASLVRHAISADVHAEKLMEKFDCDVAIASSTLVRLFDVERQQGLGKVRVVFDWLYGRGLMSLIALHTLIVYQSTVGTRVDRASEEPRVREQEGRREEARVL